MTRKPYPVTIAKAIPWKATGIGMKRAEIAEALREKPGAPADMLRYDTAFEHPKFPGVVVFPEFKVRDGKLGGKVTFGRWESFLIKLDRTHDGEQEYEISSHFKSHQSEWITYDHPRDKDGRTDYAKLEPFTLAQVIERLGTR